MAVHNTWWYPNKRERERGERERKRKREAPMRELIAFVIFTEKTNLFEIKSSEERERVGEIERERRGERSIQTLITR
jgi:hypothetical protein